MRKQYIEYSCPKCFTQLSVLMLLVVVLLQVDESYACSRVYVGVSDAVSVIDTKTNRVIARMPTGGSADSIAITPDGSKAYVVNSFSSTVLVIDTAIN